MRNLIWLIPAIFLLGCKPFYEVLSVSRTAYVVGPTNDITPLTDENSKQIAKRSIDGSVLIMTRLATKRVKFCSGTLIDGDGTSNMRVLTNHHCFAKSNHDGKATENLLLEACTNTQAIFGFVKESPAQAVGIPCQQASLRTNFDGDLAVFTLAKNPTGDLRPLEFWQGENPANRDAYIIHYPDIAEHSAKPPGEAVKLPTAALTTVDCKVLGNFSSSEWDLDRTLPYSLRHTCDLVHGSSGSALIDTETGQILGVNWGGIKISYKNAIRTDNVATRTDFIMAFLTGNVDSVVRSSKRPRSTTSTIGVAQSGQPQTEERQETKSYSDQVKDRCGSIGAMKLAEMSALWLLIFPVLPLTIRFRNK